MQKPTVNGVVPVFGENSGNSLESVSEWFWSQFAQRIDGQTFCNVSPALAGMETTAPKLSRRNRLQLYLKLHTMAFVAHARPEAPKWLRQGESFDPAPRGKSDTHACSLNKGIGCKSRTRKEFVAGTAVCTFEIASARQDSESSCDSKVLFSMRGIPACGENRSLDGLSWPGEKAEAMRWQ